LFAVALLASGQSSTLTGTYAGQIVMEGFLHFKIRPVLRRLITRMLAIIPAILVISIQGEQGSYGLLIFSQVVLSLQLPFAVIPLIKFTSDKERMKTFANAPWVRNIAWISAIIIVVLNARLVIGTIGGWMEGLGETSLILWFTVVPVIGCIFLLLIYISLPKNWRKRRPTMTAPYERVEYASRGFKKIGIAIDLGAVDAKVLAIAQQMARQNSASLVLMHVVEGVGGQLLGRNAYDNEARDDYDHLNHHAEELRQTGLEVQAILGFGRVPKEIVRLVKENEVDLLIMGGHGHRGFKDILFGASISKVRHALKIPVMVV
jgi:manganese transport protein